MTRIRREDLSIPWQHAKNESVISEEDEVGHVKDEGGPLDPWTGPEVTAEEEMTLPQNVRSYKGGRGGKPRRVQ